MTRQPFFGDIFSSQNRFNKPVPLLFLEEGKKNLQSAKADLETPGTL